MPTNNFLTCPSGCDDPLTLPAIPVEQDCTKITIGKSQISDLVLLPSGATGPTDWTDSGDWATVIDNANANNTKAKHLVVIGAVAEPEKVIVPMPKFKEKTVNRTYTVTGRTMNLTNEMYEFLRVLQCGDVSGFTFWYGNELHLFGGQDGILLKSIDVILPLSDAADAFEEATITLVYEADGDPERTDTVF